MALALSHVERSGRRDVRRRADESEFVARRTVSPSGVASRAMTRSEWVGAGALWAFVLVFVIDLVV